jgi:hypothetical protein
MTTPAAAAPRRYPGRLFLLLGLAAAPLAVAGYVVQFAAHRLATPWYLPAAATLGVALVVLSLWQARTVWRIVALVPVALLAAAAWLLVLGEPLPAYTGPVAAGHAFPAFATLRADGTSFTQHDLAGDADNVLVFFRGRW